MRTKLRLAVAGTGTLTFAVLLLLIATALTRSALLAFVTAVVGLVLVVTACAVVLAAARRSVRTGDETSTRVRNLERRAEHEGARDLAGEVDRLQEVTASLEGLDVGTALSTLRTDVEAVGAKADSAWRVSYESAVRQGRHPRSFLTVPQARELAAQYLDADELLELGPLIRTYGVPTEWDLAALRRVYRRFRSTGYWDLAALTLRRISEKSGVARDEKALSRLQNEIAVLRRPARTLPDLPRGAAHDPSGPILHMVGKVLPETQSGYTLRTHYTALAQSRRGLPVAVVGQSGITDPAVKKLTSYTHQGVDYHLLPGPVRGDALLGQWLNSNIEQLAELVRTLRPSILHAHSDFHNALIVHAVGAAYGIPTVYETRGFWEESWLARTVAAQHWERDAGSIFAGLGRPAAYELRKHAEETVRPLMDHNITLAGGMRDRILDAGQGEIAERDVSTVPNATEPELFPVQDRDPDLAASLGIPQDAVTVGYISSMVSYEGIETLIDAFALAGERVERPLYLLLVGGGSELDSLKRHVATSKVENVVFTDAVPHDDILRYYGLIDIFVVPRHRSALADLVTPLKPFEAFATGRAVVVSDVAALREIADQSGAAETFVAGDRRDLSRRIIELVRDPDRRRALGAKAAQWVREHRTWDVNAFAYVRIYRSLGYRGPGAREPGQGGPTPSPASSGGGSVQGALGRSSTRSSWASSQVGPRHRGETVERGGPAAEVGKSQADRPLRAVVVAMKPQIAGRIRRNISTLLELGAEVTVVNTTPRSDFFQGLEHPHLRADFVDVRSLAVRYQADMTRRKNERQAKWDREKAALAQKEARPEGQGTGPVSRSVLRVEKAWEKFSKRSEKARREARSRSDLAIRDQLKKVHLVNRFVEFWRASPDRIASHSPDLVVSSDLPGLVGASIAARRLGVPHLHDCHELYLESTALKPADRRVLWPIERRYMRRADAVVVVNRTIRDEYAKRYGVDGVVLRNCAPAVPEQVRSNPVNLQALAGVPQSARIVLYQGGLVGGRGLDICVKAAADFGPDTHLVFIGKGRMEAEIRDLAEASGVQDRVHLRPAVEPGDLPAYTAGADLGVIPYQPVSRNNEFALPNKVFEYTGAGLPFVASDLPELRRIVEEDGCGEVYDPYSPSELAAKVRHVLDSERYQTYRERAEYFGRKNTWESEREILVSEIRRLLKVGNRP